MTFPIFPRATSPSARCPAGGLASEENSEPRGLNPRHATPPAPSSSIQNGEIQNEKGVGPQAASISDFRFQISNLPPANPPCAAGAGDKQADAAPTLPPSVSDPPESPAAGSADSVVCTTKAQDAPRGLERGEIDAALLSGDPRFAALTPESQSVAQRRLTQIRGFEDLLGHGATPRAAARIVGLGRTTLWRWQRDYAAEGLYGLRDATGENGAKSKWEFILHNKPICERLQELYLSTVGASSDYMSAGRRTGSLALAFLLFAEEPLCPAPLATELRRGAQPAPLVRLLRRITPEQEARLRGAKHLQLHGPTSRRDMTLRLPDGRRAELPAGYLLELDDMSVNQPFFVEDADGFDLSRQGLYCRDVRSRRWLGVELVCRPREAYRAEDILRFLRRLFSLYGSPSILRLERGIWAANVIRGVKLSPAGELEQETFTRPAAPKEEAQKLSDGLAAIGVRIKYVHSPHSKGGIESAFNYLQSVIAAKTPEFLNIGRHAGEFELAAKRLRQVRNTAAAHPRALGFAPIDTLADRILDAMAFVCRNRKFAGETPDEIWARDTAAHPLPALEANQLAVFLPHARPLTLRGGLASVQIGGERHDFRAPDLFAALGDGHRITLKLDETEPTLGAAVYNREPAGPDKFLGWAAYEIPGPQLDVAEAPAGARVHELRDLYGLTAEADDGLLRRQRHDRAVRTAFRALPRPGQPAVKIAEQRDGRGGVTRIESGAGNSKFPIQNSKAEARPRPAPGADLLEAYLSRERAPVLEPKSEYL